MTPLMEAGMKILVIDDDPAMTELLEIILEAICAKVYTAFNGQQGIELCQKEKPDVIILDLMMPEPDGWQVCRTIRQFSQVPILILSALDNPGLIAKALDAGADDYLIKPVSSSMLIAHIQNLLRRSRALSADTANVSIKEENSSI
jgi:DNA-binding response OmpR family regulator